MSDDASHVELRPFFELGLLADAPDLADSRLSSLAKYGILASKPPSGAAGDLMQVNALLAEEVEHGVHARFGHVLETRHAAKEP